MPTLQDQKANLIAELHRLIDQTDASLTPVVRRASRLATLCDEEEYRLLFDMHLNGVDETDLKSSPIPKWSSPTRRPAWNLVDAFNYDRAAPDGKVFLGPLEHLESILHTVREGRRSAQSKADQRELATILEIESSYSRMIVRIRNRVATFNRTIEATQWVQKTNHPDGCD
jgi:hypothetical protein